jgi:hypothetical protein
MMQKDRSSSIRRLAVAVLSVGTISRVGFMDTNTKILMLVFIGLGAYGYVMSKIDVK